MTTETAIGVPTMLGHIALRVRDIDRAVEFYSNALGLTVKNHGRVAFLGARTEASHEIALFPLPADAPGPEAGRVGMYHMAWEMASFEDLKALHDRLIAQNRKIVGYSDGQCNVMFHDPDGNELEAIWEPAPEVIKQLKESNSWPKLERAPGF
ncbi:MAG: VOC family protein [bacterium]